jgi:hypothetical protein
MKDMPTGKHTLISYLIYAFSLLTLLPFFICRVYEYIIITGEVFRNIKIKHKQFARFCSSHPNDMVILVSEFGADLMKQSEVFFLDGTFDTTECKLVLMILMALTDNVAIPCAYLLFDSRETDTYEFFFTVNKLSPSPFLLVMS